ncbi:hypothetical protein I4U23_017547 [Adineta vaga]|nr:hypothetical protein I4U23_017547 [Adineta vaga]
MHNRISLTIFVFFCLLIHTLYGIPREYYRTQQDQQLASVIDELNEHPSMFDSSEINGNHNDENEDQVNKRNQYSKFRLSPLWLSRRTRGNRFYGKPLWISRQG